jgi:hypothetical protein
MNILKMSAALAVVAGFAGVASADIGNPASANADASVTVIAPITVTNTVDLSFGFITSEAAGSATVSDGGVFSRTGGVEPVTGGTVSAAAFTVSGAPSFTYDLVVSDNDFGGDFVLATTQSASTGVGAITVNVGGTITVPAGTVAGDYDGTVTLTATYD